MKRIIAGIILLAAAGAAAFYIKDYIDRKHPEHAIPRISVTADGTAVETAVSGFSWKFYTGDTVIKPELSPLDGLAVPQTVLLGGENIEIAFSQPATELKVKRSASFTYAFEYADDLAVPYESGGYIYEVYARFERGAVLYYFYILVE